MKSLFTVQASVWSRALLLALLFTLSALASSCQQRSPDSGSTTAEGENYLSPISEKWLVPNRLIQYTFHLPGILLEDPVVEILLPDGYFDAANAARHYPTVWMLHGGNSSPDFYNSQMLFDANNEPIGIAKRPVIAVLPYAGVTGYYVDWFNFGAFGPPEWVKDPRRFESVRNRGYG